MIEHVALLPFGYTATFLWANNDLSIAWKPDRPRFRSRRAWEKFRRAYDNARREFVTDIAATLNGKIMILDTDGAMETVEPPVKQ
jgi:hypothetical protein